MHSLFIRGRRFVLVAAAVLLAGATAFASLAAGGSVTAFEEPAVQGNGLADAGYTVIDGGFVVKDGVLVSYVGSEKNVVIPAGKGIKEIGESAFKQSDVVHVEIPAGVTKIGESAFSECFGLEYVKLPEGLVSIGGHAFYRDGYLMGIVVPGSVTDIGANALANFGYYEDYDGFYIWGTPGTCAAAYAAEQGIAFADISKIASISAESPSTVNLSSSFIVWLDVKTTFTEGDDLPTLPPGTSFASSNEDVAARGKGPDHVLAKASGTAKITLVEPITGKTATCDVTVTEAGPVPVNVGEGQSLATQHYYTFTPVESGRYAFAVNGAPPKDESFSMSMNIHEALDLFDPVYEYNVDNDRDGLLSFNSYMRAGETYYLYISTDPSQDVALSITKQPKYVTGIEVVQLPAKTTFIHNYDYSYKGTFERGLAGLQLKVSYSDGSNATYTHGDDWLGMFDGEQIDVYCPGVLGENIVRIGYAGKTAVFKADYIPWSEGFVDAPAVTEGTPVTFEKMAGDDSFDKVYKFSPSVAGRYEFFANGEGLVSGVTRYVNFYDDEGDLLDDAYNGGSSETGDLLISSILDAGKTYFIQVGSEYEGFENPPGDSFDFTVSKATDITGIEITSPPTKTEYIVGYESYVDFLGLQIEVSFADGSAASYSYSTHYQRFMGMYVGLAGPAGNDGDRIKLGDNTFTVKYAGFTDTFDISGVANPVDYISVSPTSIKLFENTDGYKSTGWDSAQNPIPFWYYNFGNSVREYVIHYTNGNTETYNSQEAVYSATGYSLYSSNDQYSNPWEVGKHDVTYSYLGKTAQLEVEIVESPVESFTVLPTSITLIENANGYEATDSSSPAGNPYWHYYGIPGTVSLSDLNFTYEVKFKGGDKQAYTGEQLLDALETEAEKYGVVVDTDWYYLYSYAVNPQRDIPLTLGENPYPITFAGATDEGFKVNIVESPVESFAVSPASLTLIEGTDGYEDTRWDYGTQTDVPYWHYSGVSTSSFNYDVKFKGENAKTYTYEQLMEAAEVETAKYGIETYYPLEEVRSQYDTPLIFGTNPYPIRFMGKTADFTVNIVKEIAGIAINTPPSKASYTVGLETLDLAGLSVTVSYNDDREPVTVNYTGNENDFSVDSLLVSRVGENANTYAVAYKGFETTFSVAGTSPIPQAPPGGEGPDIPAITLPEPDQGGGEPPVPVAVEQEVAAGETVYFAFMPTKAGTYRFSVKGGDGADAYLFDSEGNMLAYRLVTDDGQTNTSGIGTLAASPSVTILEYELEGNTNYYVGAKFQSTTETGKIGVSAEEVERPPDVIRGDVNGDGEVDPLDLTRLRKYLVNKDTAISFEAADINDDKLVDPLDLTRLRKYLGRAIDSL